MNVEERSRLRPMNACSSDGATCELTCQSLVSMDRFAAVRSTPEKRASNGKMLTVEGCHVDQLREKLQIVKLGIERQQEASLKGSSRSGKGSTSGSIRNSRKLQRRPSLDVAAMSEKIRSVSGRLFASHEEEMKFVEKTYGKLGWPTQIVNFFYSLPVQVSSIALLTIDVCIIIFELYLDIEYPSCFIIKRDAVSCCDAACSPVGSYGSSSGSFSARRRCVSAPRRDATAWRRSVSSRSPSA